MFWGEVLRHIRGEAMLPPPHLIVGVGHATHLPMLAARAACGGRTVVLMKPSLPLSLFDLIFVPRHDHYPRKGNVVGTWGVICPTTDEGKVQDEGLVLIGGPNRIYDWQPDAVADAVGAIADASPEIHWTACDSRRTPAGLPERVTPRDNLPGSRGARPPKTSCKTRWRGPATSGSPPTASRCSTKPCRPVPELGSSPCQPTPRRCQQIRPRHRGATRTPPRARKRGRLSNSGRAPQRLPPRKPPLRRDRPGAPGRTDLAPTARPFSLLNASASCTRHRTRQAMVARSLEALLLVANSVEPVGKVAMVRSVEALGVCDALVRLDTIQETRTMSRCCVAEPRR